MPAATGSACGAETTVCDPTAADEPAADEPDPDEPDPEESAPEESASRGSAGEPATTSAGAAAAGSAASYAAVGSVVGMAPPSLTRTHDEDHQGRPGPYPGPVVTPRFHSSSMLPGAIRHVLVSGE